MIARMWRGSVRTEKAAEYVEIVERTGIEGYRRTPGNRGAQILTRDHDDGRTELITLSWWSSTDDIRAFAGDDVEKAKFYPEDDADLLDREETVSHFDVAPLPAADRRRRPRRLRLHAGAPGRSSAGLRLLRRARALLTLVRRARVHDTCRAPRARSASRRAAAKRSRRRR